MGINLGFLPWPALKRAFYQIRGSLFSKPRPDRQHLVTEASIEEVRRELASVYSFGGDGKGFGFTNVWEFSFEKHGEDLNMRLPLYIPDEFEYYQLHIRGYEQPDGTTELDMHIELEPSEHPKGHLNGTNYKVGKALDIYKGVLEPNLGFSTRRVKP